MEVAGAVLGAVPIIIYALESYGKAVEVMNDAHKWLDTIEEIQDVVEVQTEMLRVTLRTLGVEWAPQTGIPIEVIEMALKERKPLQWERFVRIIQRMDVMMTEMARDLCPDMKGPERFGIAAALTWGFLYLCDSAWLDESIEDGIVGVTFTESNPGYGPRAFGPPFLTSTFPGLQVMSDSRAGAGHSLQTKGAKFIAQQIQHQALYSLAIRLMELGLDKDFGQLRKEYEEDESFEDTGVFVSDFEIARSFIDSLNHDCGIGYRNAVEHCLRFLFAGSSEDCFLDARFRKAFFDMVIAPVQNVYNTIDQYQYQP
ncbi:hypothetical protein E8E13_006509 [Curvularia kusanoi]|uniref:DUF7580 domain-containing protein n=1 Tax=Curvularia kusanoi TaxID=90978 RepID=A0A9P4TAV9_CURKU|nr:hypothetical protein E8E13_006509 [Curvularia kusanoi]